MILTSDSQPRRSSAVRLVPTVGQVVVVLRSDVRHLDAIGEVVWEGCDGTASLASIAEKIAVAYEAEMEEVLADVIAFAQDLLDSGFVHLTGEALPAAVNRHADVADADVERWKTAASDLLADYHGHRTAFLSGSLVEGLGNETSDLDVFVIVDDKVAAPDAPAPTVIRDVRMNADIRVDAEVWTLPALTTLAQAIEGTDLGDPQQVISFSQRGAALAHRLRVGIALDHAEELEALRSAFDFDKLAQIQAFRFLLFYGNAAEDTTGAIAAGDYGTAQFTSRTALGHAADALLHAHGITTMSDKWRARRLQRHGDQRLIAGYHSALIDSSADPTAVLAAARDRLWYATTLAHLARTLLDTKLDEEETCAG
ncbi:PqqD family protein [Streptomyces rubiginosohelvolus]|uniref:PqqD family protein n=1 Tax=Streptomyces rubiginosohelvolus TaxID=67362 RepID=UPI0035E37541